MNTAEDRQAIATAASTVTGVTVKPRYVQITKPGLGFVQLASLDRDSSGFGFIVTWRVVVAMHQDLADAELWIDTKAADLIVALGDVLVVTRVEPIDLVLGPEGSVAALQVTGTRPDAG